MSNVTISEEEYKELKQDQNFLRCLEHQGVDNWDGYDMARDEYNEVWGEDD